MSNPLHHKQPAHILDEDVVAASADRRPSMARDLRQAKLILQENSGASGDSVYDHMSVLLRRILAERPPDVIDYFEEYSQQVRLERLHVDDNRLRETFVEPHRLAASQFLVPLLTFPLPDEFYDFRATSINSTANNDEDDDDDDAKPSHDAPLTDVMHLHFYWQLAGFGFPPGHAYLLSCSLGRLLASTPAIRSVRFWGQLYGLEHSYMVAEADLADDELQLRTAADLAAIEEERARFDAERAERIAAELKPAVASLVPQRPTTPVYENPFEYPPPNRRHPATVPPLPRAQLRPPRQAPAEPTGSGLNRKSYFVCTRLGAPWTELPPVTSQQMQVARKIRKFLTGRLDAEVCTYPEFPGVERNYVRAIIARITAGTYVAPIGYYRIGKAGAENDEEEEDEVDEEGNDNDKPTAVDPGYEPLAPRELLLAQNWTHFRPNILQQGRINWLDPRSLADKDDVDEGEEEAEEEEEEENENDDAEVEEIGPGLLTPCSEDRSGGVEGGATECWQLQRAHKFDGSQSMVVMRSLLWPGAVAFAQLRTHDCLYVGWGHKRVERNFTPATIPPVQAEYLLGPEVMEMSDPGVEAEDEWRRAHEPAALVDEELDEEGGEEGDEMDAENEEDDE